MAENDGPPPGPSAPETTTHGRWKDLAQFFPAIVAAVVLFVSFVAGIVSPVTTTKQLVVVGSLAPVAQDHWEIRGRVLLDGDAVREAVVWGIVEYANGQHDSPPATHTDERGGFSVGPVLSTLGACTAQVTTNTNEHTSAQASNQRACDNFIDGATIYARKDVGGSWFQSATVLRGEDAVRPAGNVTQPVEVLGLSPLKLAPLPAIFLVSAMLPFFGKQTRRKYLAGIVMAFIFTGLMISYISLGLRYVTTEGKAKGIEILELGFASIYRGSYVKEVPPEWVFSFTSRPKLVEAVIPETKAGADTTPPPAEQNAAHTPGSAAAPNPGTTAPAQPAATVPPKAETVLIDRGFGAPLWVLLVSVIGAGVLTVALLVGEINKMPAEDQPDQILGHLQGVVEHQLFILFAPISAIFVYQTLVVGASATSSFTVALAALGAGPSLSALLTKAAASAASLLGSSNKQPANP